MREIPLGKGYVAIVDDEDYELVSRFKWHAHEQRGTKAVYAIRNGPRDSNGKRRNIQMHRMIAGTPDGMDTDHVNRNGLDNRRANLRMATRSQNLVNSDVLKKPNCTSRYRGVNWFERLSRWRAQISVGGKKRHIGVYHTEEEAARAYDAASRAAFGNFARVNFELEEAR